MSEIYNHTSGNYENYLAERATEQVSLQIKNAANQATLTSAVCTTRLSNQMDKIESNMIRAATGLRVSINQNTFATIASAKMLQNTFLEGFDTVNKTLDIGFAGISSSIGELSNTFLDASNQISNQLNILNQMQNKICSKLDEIHDIVNNPLLTQSRELYNRALVNYSKGFFEEGLEDIKQAVEKNKTDYISWYLLGKFYLFGVSQFSRTVNLKEALTSFGNAAKYITPDISVSPDALKLAAEIYYLDAYTNYLLAVEQLDGNKESASEYLSNAKKLSLTSNDFSNKMLESLYLAARCESLLGNAESSLKIIDSLIEKDAVYTLRLMTDPDFSNLTKEILDLIEIKRKDLFIKNQEFQQTIKSYEEDYHFFNTPFANTIKTEIKAALDVNAFNKDTPYLDLIDYKNRYYNLEQLFSKEDFPCDRRVFAFKAKYSWDGENSSPVGDFLNGDEFFTDFWQGKNIAIIDRLLSLYLDRDLFNSFGISKFSHDESAIFEGNTAEWHRHLVSYSGDSSSWSEYNKNLFEEYKKDEALYGNNNELEIYDGGLIRDFSSWKLCFGSHYESKDSDRINHAYLKSLKYPQFGIVEFSPAFLSKLKKSDMGDEAGFRKFLYQNKDTLILFERNEKNDISVYKPSILKKSIAEVEMDFSKAKREKEEADAAAKEEEARKKHEEKERIEQEKVSEVLRLRQACEQYTKPVRNANLLYSILFVVSCILGGVFAGVFGAAIGALIVNLIFTFYCKPRFFKWKECECPGGKYLVNAIFVTYFFPIYGIAFHFVTGFWVKAIIFIVVFFVWPYLYDFIIPYNKKNKK